MNNLKVWPHLTIVAVVCAVLAGVGVALWMRNDRTAAAEELPNAARIQRVEGDVAIDNSDATATANKQWIAATGLQRSLSRALTRMDADNGETAGGDRD
jgi:hypothetical protein